MNLYFDTEFTGLHKGTNLISIGILDENKRYFYAELVNYGEVSDWIKENVVSNLLMNDNREGFMVMHDRCVKMKDNFERVREELNRWLSRYDEVQFVSDVSHYDFVLLVDLICGEALSLPKNISAVCRDINQDIADYLSISDKEAFDKNREELAGMGDSGKHNALHDADVIRQIDYIIRKIK